MAGSCCTRRANVHYEVTFSDGRKQKYESVSAAQAAGAASKEPYTFKAVPA